MTDKYIIRVTAGADYDVKKHQVIPVNQADTVKVSSALMDAEINVRVQDYAGLPRNSPATSPYFSAEPHAYNKDRYSIALRFTPKQPPPPSASSKSGSKEGADGDDVDDEDNDDEDDEDDAEEEESEAKGIRAADLQWGNDFDHPIRDRLPPGFGTAMNIVKWWIDPGLEGDAYADSPYLYGPALSSFNAVHVGPGEHDPGRGGLWFDEGGDEDGHAARAGFGAPADARARMKWALRADAKDRWVWEYGRTYGLDFFNPYLDFSEFSLRLPGFTLPIMKYWDGQSLRSPKRRSHVLRYVLRNRSTAETYLVVTFTLYRREDVEEDGTVKQAALDGNPLLPPADESAAAAEKEGGGGKEAAKEEEKFDEAEVLEEARRRLSNVGVEDTADDDVD
ncbi:uncharacterized protein E0L32_004574 [Thyridium curvatum]|uniref:Domain of unknown function at the cortex 1 domain-containing protein n=1 Tax=Thyridium curvatum TaxID=1093900 RepID=A0A507B697_9PEZI|nr:uncharacterized protein E0L32_004574 [Thyridium curvatum]TPX15297.1 hypothetical protein E0L32_004574 [Thyridium curvatum]